MAGPQPQQYVPQSVGTPVEAVYVERELRRIANMLMELRNRIEALEAASGGP